MKILTLAIIALLVATPSAFAQKAEKKSRNTVDASLLQGSEKVIFRKVGDVELSMNIFKPKDWKASDKRAAIVFFFGGGWTSGTVTQFAPHAKHLSELGMVAAVADYRVASRHKVKAVACVEDAKAAVAWLRENASSWGIDPNRLAAGGGSAGGHLAACTAVVPGFESTTAKVSSVPNATILFNPALVLASVDGERSLTPEKLAELEGRLGDKPVKVSPYHHVGPNQPPCLIFHGKADSTVPYRTAELFAEASTKAGNRCELVGFEGEGHGFFNFGRGNGTNYTKTLAAMDDFLKSLGYLTN